MTVTTAARIAVVGGGITGLLTARRLALAGHDVTVFEAGPRLGGHLLTVDIAGLPVDVGAESLHLVPPQARALVAELGLADSVVGARRGTSWLWTPRGLRALPAGVGPAGPTRLAPLLRSRVLSPAGLVRAGLEPAAARLRGGLGVDAEHDVSVGSFVSSRFGPQVSARLVDPLLGGLHSGDVDRLSLAACTPGLLPVARSGGSLVRRGRRPAPAAGGAPAVTFASWPGGLRTLLDRVVATSPGLAVRTRTRVERVSTLPGGGHRLDLTGSGAAPSEVAEVDAVVLAVNAPTTARLVEPHAPGAADLLRQTQLASTASVALGFDAAHVRDVPALAGNGVLVPSSTKTLLKAVTHLSTKWPHLSGGPTYLLRLSAGRAWTDTVERLDDDALVDHLRRDLRRFTGLDAAPTHVHVQRWSTGLPQLTVGHVDRTNRVRALLAARLPGVAVAGASYDGVGLSSCITSADRAAQDTLARLAERAPEVSTTRSA